jgi:hypothetical protein
MEAAMTSSITLRSSAVVILLQALMAGAAAQHAPAAEHLTLHHAFDLGEAGAWVDVSVPLRPEGWRVGGADGPAASAEQLQAVLGRLEALVIGGRCAGTSAGPTYYPCTFELAQPRIDSATVPTPQRIDAGWVSTSADTLTRFDAGVVLAISVPPRTASTTAVHAMKTSFRVSGDFLGLMAPAAMRERAAGAAGQALRFRFRATPNPVQPSQVDARSGVVILGTQGMLPRHVRPARPNPV